jgi:hypothetical protein
MLYASKPVNYHKYISPAEGTVYLLAKIIGNLLKTRLATNKIAVFRP